jgi:hypothetical protein
VSEPQTEAGLLSLPGADPVYLDDGPGVIHAISEAIRHAERQAVAAWLDTEAEGLLKGALYDHRLGICDLNEFGFERTDEEAAAALVSHLRERMTP